MGLSDLLRSWRAARAARVLAVRGADGRHVLTAAETLDRSESLAAALIEFGLVPGARVGILARAGSDAVLGAIAVAAAGSVPVLADAALDDRALGGALLEAAATHVLVADAEQLDRVVRLRPDLPDLEIVLVFEPPGEDRPSPAMSVQEACARGRALLQEPPGRFEMPASTGPAAPALTTVGEDGRLAEWTEAVVAAAVRAFVERFDLRADDVVVLRSSSFDLPFLAAITCCLERGAVVAPDVARGGLIEAVPVLQASVVVAPARDLLELFDALVAEIDARSWLYRWAAQWSLARGREPARHPRLFRLAEVLALDGLRGRLGGRLRRIVVLDGVPGQAEADFFRALGVELSPEAAS